MKYQKDNIKQIQAVLTDAEKRQMKEVVRRSGMKQMYWVRQLIIDAITTDTAGA
jgi:hypothetical protein